MYTSFYMYVYLSSGWYPDGATISFTKSLRTNFSANFFSTGRVGADTGWLSISAADVQSECPEQFDCM